MVGFVYFAIAVPIVVLLAGLAYYFVREQWAPLAVVGGWLLLFTVESYMGNIVISRMCAREGGVRIYETVSGVGTYFDAQGRGCEAGCQYDLLVNRFDSVEAELTAEALAYLNKTFDQYVEFGRLPLNATRDNLPTRPGLYRYSLDRTDASCVNFIRTDFTHENIGKSFPARVKCIRSQPIGAVSAEYQRVNRDWQRVPAFMGDIKVLSREISKLGTGRVLASKKIFRWEGRPLVGWHAYFANFYSCGDKPQRFLTNREILNPLR